MDNETRSLPQTDRGKEPQDRQDAKLTEHERAVEELRDLDNDLREMDQTKLEGQKKALEAARTDIETRRQILDELTTQTTEIEQYISRAWENQAGSAPNELKEIQAALGDCREKVAHQTEALAASKEKEAQLDDEQMHAYQSLVEEVDTLTKKATSLMSDKDVQEKLLGSKNPDNEGYARIENSIRDSVVLALENELGKGQASSQRKEYVRQLTQKFLTEEFTAKGVYNTQDQDERMRRMGDISRSIILGLQNSFIRLNDMHKGGEINDVAFKDAMSGVAIANLAGIAGSPSEARLVYLTRDVNAPRDHESRKALDRSFFLDHLGTMNFMLSQTEAAGDKSNDITRISDAESLRKTLAQVEIGRETDHGPALPDGQESHTVRPAVIDEIKRDYSADAERAKNNSAKEREELESQLQTAQDELSKASERKMRLAEARDKLYKLCDNSYNPDFTINKLNSEKSRLVSDEKANLRMKEDLSREKTGFFAGGRRREIRREINTIANKSRENVQRIHAIDAKLREIDEAAKSVGAILETSDRWKRSDDELSVENDVAKLGHQVEELKRKIG